MEKTKRKPDSFVEKYFQLSKYGTNVKTEIIAGITTFVTMAYVLLVIPSLLKAAGMNSAGLLGDKTSSLTIFNDQIVGALFTATCLI